VPPIEPQFRLEFDRLVFRRLVEEGNDKFPFETGGVLLGWILDQLIAVDGYLGPGPNAKHQRRAFEPDVDWQSTEIAERYFASGRRRRYLGDWHTHPGARSGYLSRQDRVALYRISRTAEAQIPAPLMAILYGRPEAWRLAVWKMNLPIRWYGIWGASVTLLCDCEAPMLDLTSESC
jgi:integrative and conjugative element protein (TIGR02256 family)